MPRLKVLLKMVSRSSRVPKNGCSSAEDRPPLTADRMLVVSLTADLILVVPLADRILVVLPTAADVVVDVSVVDERLLTTTLHSSSHSSVVRNLLGFPCRENTQTVNVN